MLDYLIIFAYYLFFCFVLFYFIRNRNYYRWSAGSSNNILKGIFGWLAVWINSLSCKIGSLLISKIFFKAGNKNSLLVKIDKAGADAYITAENYLGYKIILLILFFIGGFFAGRGIMNPFGPGVIGGAAGYFIPDMVIMSFSRRRRMEIERDLPAIIDLLAVATLSGQNIYNAIKIVISKYDGSVSSEFTRFIRDIDAGAGKLQAYKNLLNRSDSHEFRNFIFLLMQAEKYGSSINDILKRKSDYMKFESYQNLEKEIRKKSVMLLLPLVFLIMPSFIILVGGPLIYSIGGNLLNL